MDDLKDMLEGVLSNPESMNKIRQMVGGLMSDDNPPQKENSGGNPLQALLSASANANEQQTSGGLGDLLSNAENMGKIVKIMSALNSRQDDNRTHLLLALKPHLSDERAARVDNAVKILRLLSIAPLLKDTGILF